MKIPHFPGKKFTLSKFAVVSAIGFLLTLTATAETVVTNEFWICNTTNTENLGTLDNPFDGSDQTKFDAVMNSLPPNCTIHILAGTYETWGQINWTVKSYQKIIGSGMDVTILQLATNVLIVPGGPFVIANSGPVTNAEVSDLTVDCNYAGQAESHEGIGLSGTQNAVRRVRVKNLGYYSGGSSAWGIALGNPGLPGLPESDGNIVEECEVDPLAGGNSASAITFQCSGIIRGNRVFLNGGGADSAQVGINVSGNDYTLIEGNQVVGADGGLYNDAPGNTNLIITDNTFRDVRQGILFIDNGNIRQNVTILGNTIMLTTNAPYGFGNSKCAIAFGGDSTNINIIGNCAGWDGQPNPGELGYSYFLSLTNAQGVSLVNNRIDSRLENAVPAEGGLNFISDNNYDLTGNYLSQLNIPTVGGIPVSSLGLALISSAEASSALTNLGLPGSPAWLVTNNEGSVTLNGTFGGTGSALTGLNASQLSSGTVPLGRLPGSVVTTDANGNIKLGPGGVINAPGGGVFLDGGIVITNANSTPQILGAEGQVALFYGDGSAGLFANASSGGNNAGAYVGADGHANIGGANNQIFFDPSDGGIWTQGGSLGNELDDGSGDMMVTNNLTVNGSTTANTLTVRGNLTVNGTLTVPQTEHANEYWISPSTNTANLGTLDEPFDGSTEPKFDNLLNNFPPYCRIHLLPGVYQTKGDGAVSLKSGQNIIGSGIDITTIQLATNSIIGGDGIFVLRGYPPPDTNMLISDLTVDCDYSGNPGVTCSGIGIDGVNNTVNRVKVKNMFWALAYNTESWGISLGGMNETIENCIATDFGGGYQNRATTFTISGDGTYTGSGIIRNNTVTYTNSPAPGPAVNGSFNNGILIEGNHFTGVSAGYYSDTGGNTNILITHNVFNNVANGVFYAPTGQYRDNISVNDNIIMLLTNDYGGFNPKYGIYLGTYCTNVTVANNVIGWSGQPTANIQSISAYLALSEPGVQGIIAHDNRIDPFLENTIGTTNNNYFAYNNYDSQGNYLANPNLNSPIIVVTTNSVIPPGVAGESVFSVVGGTNYWINDSGNGVFKTIHIP